MPAMTPHGGMKTYLRSLTSALDVVNGHVRGLAASPPWTEPR